MEKANKTAHPLTPTANCCKTPIHGPAHQKLKKPPTLRYIPHASIPNGSHLSCIKRDHTNIYTWKCLKTPCFVHDTFSVPHQVLLTLCNSFFSMQVQSIQKICKTPLNYDDEPKGFSLPMTIFCPLYSSRINL